MFGEWDRSGTRQRRRPRGQGWDVDGQHHRDGRRYETEKPPIFLSRLPINRKQELILIVVLLLALAAWFLTPLSDVVAQWVLLSVPISSDVALGREALRSLSLKYPPAVDRWGVADVGWDLVDSLQRQRHGRYRYGSAHSTDHDSKDWRDVDQFAWNFGVVRAPFANAFALPGGVIRVTDSLLRQLRLTDGELAALIGHEMGHVLNRHSQRKSVKDELFATVARALSYEDHDDHEETFGEAVGEILLRSAAFVGERGFSRRDEYEADAAAWDIMVQSNKYDPRGVQSLLAKLWALSGGSGETRWESTHPGTKDRIKALQTKWEGLSQRERKRFANFPVA